MPANLIARLADRSNNPTITVERAAEAVDTGGSVTKTWAVHISDVAAVTDLITGTEEVRYGRENNRGTGTVYVQAGLDITAADRLDIGGVKYDIQWVDTPMDRADGDYLSFMTLAVEQTDGGT